MPEVTPISMEDDNAESLVEIDGEVNAGSDNTDIADNSSDLAVSLDTTVDAVDANDSNDTSNLTLVYTNELLAGTQKQIDEAVIELRAISDTDEQDRDVTEPYVVALEDEQWSRIDNAIEKAQGAVKLHNTLMVILLLFVCSIVGMRLFSELSRGLRHE